MTRGSSTSLYANLEGLLDTFCGDFDNYQQVCRDREDGLLPREGGGHEHMHCTLIPVKDSSRLAAFYFDGNPQRIFRFRYYEVMDDGTMQLNMLHPDLEQQLRQEENPTMWPEIFRSFEASSKVSLLDKCDVRWSDQMDPVQHKYAKDAYPDRKGFHAVMVYGQAILNSTMIPGAQILVKDQLSLWDNEFWIHDRGFHLETGEFIYGNQRGIPYQLERVTRINNQNERIIERPDLQWTLGSEWRTEDEYQEKLKPIGGVSTKLNS